MVKHKALVFKNFVGALAKAEIILMEQFGNLFLW
jgi:hypothetical protein